MPLNLFDDLEDPQTPAAPAAGGLGLFDDVAEDEEPAAPQGLSGYLTNAFNYASNTHKTDEASSDLVKIDEEEKGGLVKSLFKDAADILTPMNSVMSKAAGHDNLLDEGIDELDQRLDNVSPTANITTPFSIATALLAKIDPAQQKAKMEAEAADREVRKADAKRRLTEASEALKPMKVDPATKLVADTVSGVFTSPEQLLPTAGAVAGGLVGGPPGAAIGAAITSIPSANTAFTQARRDAEENLGATPEEAKDYGYAVAGVQMGSELVGGPLEALALGAAKRLGMKKLTTEAAKDALLQKIRGRGGRILAAATVEGAENVAGTEAQGKIEQTIADNDLFSAPEAKDKIKKRNAENAANRLTNDLESFGQGFLAGGVVGAPVAITAHAVEQGQRTALLNQANADAVKDESGRNADRRGAATKQATEEAMNTAADQATANETAGKTRAFEQAERERAADAAAQATKATEQEAGFQTMERQRTAEKLASNPTVAGVTAEPVTPEDVVAQKQQAVMEETTRKVASRQENLQKAAERRIAAAKAKEEAALKNQTRAQRIAQTKHETGLMDTVITENPKADARRVAELFQKRLEANPTPVATQAKPAAIPTAAMAAPVVSDNKASDADIRVLAAKAGIDVGAVNPALNMAGSTKQKAGNPLDAIKTLVGKNRQNNVDVQNLIAQKKLVLAPNAKAVGRTATGAADYDTETGKMFLYMDKINPKNVAGIMAGALHESTHAGQFADRNGRGQILKDMMGPAKFSEAVKLVRDNAKKNTIAGRAVKLAAKEGKANPGSEDYEIMAHFVSEATKARSGFGRMGGVVRDIKAGANTFMRKLGVDLDMDLNDVEAATQHVAGEIAKTDTTPNNRRTGNLNMVVGKMTPTAIRLRGEGVPAYRDVDGYDKVIASDADSEFNINPMQRKKLNSGNPVLVGTMLKNPTLTESYPELNDVPVYSDPGTKSGASWYENGDGSVKELRVAPYLIDGTLNNPEEMDRLHDLILHELQHGVQSIEGSSRGGNPAQFRTASDKAAIRDNNKAVRALKSVIERINPEELGLDRSTAGEVREAIRAFNDDAMSAPALGSELSELLETSDEPYARTLVKEMTEALETIEELKPAIQEMADRTTKQYMKLRGEQEAYFTQDNRKTPQSKLPAAVPTDDDTLLADEVGGPTRLAAGEPISLNMAAQDDASRTLTTSNQSKDLNQSKDNVESAYSDFITRAIRQRVMDEKGQDILSDMIDDGVNPQEVSKTFWGRTYFRMPAQVQDRFQQLLKGHTGMEPGSTISLDQDNNPNVARDWLQIADEGQDLPNDAEYLEGTDRGYVVLMQEANERFAAKSTTPSPLSLSMAAVTDAPKSESRKELFPGFDKIPNGTSVLATHGLEYQEPTRAKVVSQRVIDLGDGTRTYPVADFGDGKLRTLTPGDVKEVYAPRSLGMAAEEDQVAPEVLSNKETLRRIIDHGVRSQTADIKLAEDYDTKFRRALKLDGSTEDFKEMNKTITKLLTDVDEAKGETKQDLWNTFANQYPNVAPIVQEMRDKIDENSDDLIRTMLNTGRELSPSEIKTVQTLLANKGRYLTRAYSAFQQRLGRKWAESRWSNYQRYLADYLDDKELSPKRKQDVEEVLAGINHLAKRMEIPPNDALVDLPMSKLEDMYEDNVDQLDRLVIPPSDNPDTAKKLVMINALAARRDSLSDEVKRNMAEQAAKEIMGLAERTSNLSRNFSDIARDPGTLKERENIAPEIRHMLGEISNPAGRVLSTLATQAALKARMNVLSDLIRDNTGKLVIPASRVDEPGMRKKFPKQMKGAVYGPLNGFFATPATYNAITDSVSAFYSYKEAMQQLVNQPTILLGKGLRDAARFVTAPITRTEKLLGVVVKPVNWAGNALGSPLTMLRSGNFSPAAAFGGAHTAWDYVQGTMFNTTTELLDDSIRYMNIEAVDVAEMQRVLGDKIKNYMDGKTDDAEMENFIRNHQTKRGLARRVGRSALAGYAVMDNWAKIANFHQRTNMLQAYYEAAGEERTPEQIKREAGDVTSFTNISPERVPKVLRITEGAGLTKFIPYFAEVMRTTWTNYAQAFQDLARAANTENPQAAAIMRRAANARFFGNTLASIAMPAQFPIASSMALAAIGIAGSGFSLTPDEDDARKKRRMLGDFNRYQDLVTVGKDQNGHPIYYPISTRVDPSGPMTDFMRILVNTEDHKEALSAMLKAAKDLLVAPQILTHMVKAATQDTVPESRIARLLPGMTAAVQRWVSDLGVNPTSVNKTMYTLDGLVPGIIAAQDPKYLPRVDEKATGYLGTLGLDILRYMGGSFETLKPAGALQGYKVQSQEAHTSNNSKFNDNVLLSNKMDATTLQKYITTYAGHEHNRMMEDRKNVASLRAWGYKDEDIGALLKAQKWSEAEIGDMLAGTSTVRVSLKSLKSTIANKSKSLSPEESAKMKDRLEKVQELLSNMDLAEQGIEVTK